MRGPDNPKTKSASRRQDLPAAPLGLTAPSDQPVLRTERMILRRPIEADREEFVRVSEVCKEGFAPWYPLLPPEDSFDGVFDRMLKADVTPADSATHCKLIGFLDDGRIGGFFNLNEIVRGPFRCGYAGWSVNVEHWGRGLGTEGVLALLDVAFAPAPKGFDLHRVQANIIPTNVASLRLAEKAGFRREGLALRYLQIAGRWQDHVMTAKLTDEHTRQYL